MTRVISIDDLRGLFSKPYGAGAPTKEQWAEFYDAWLWWERYNYIDRWYKAAF